VPYKQEHHFFGGVQSAGSFSKVHQNMIKTISFEAEEFEETHITRVISRGDITFLKF